MENIEFINDEQNQMNVNENTGNTPPFVNEPDNDLEFEPQEEPNIIKVVGVGGGGSNAVNYMFKQGIKGVDFVVCNTDMQSLQASPVPLKVKLGNRKLGAGSRPEVGYQAALDSLDELKEALEGETQMLFITAGMGGGTGTGAAPVIAKLAKEMDILTVGIVSIPFDWEGAKRVNIAKRGIEELRQYVDTLIVISNNKLRELYGNLSLREAFSKADDILKTAAKGIAELITVPGYVNVDFEDVKTVMTQNESGKAIMSSAKATGEERALEAVEEALSSPLLDDNDINGASDILLHIITGTKELTMDEIEEITEYIQSKASVDGVKANLIWGNGFDESLGEALSVTIIATGFENKKTAHPLPVDEVTSNPFKNKAGTDSDKKVVHRLDKEESSEKEASPVKEEAPKNTEKKETVQEEITEPVIVKKTPAEPKTPETKTEEKVVLELFPDEDENSTPVVEKKVAETMPKIEKKPEPAQESKPQVNQPSAEEAKHAEERRRKLKGLSYSLSDFEKTPAYIRKQVQLDDSIPSQEEEVSRYILETDNKNNTVINKGNSFLNKDVD